MTKRKQASGFAAVILASLLFGCGYSIGSIVEESGMSKTCNSLWVFLIAVLLNLIITAARGKNPFHRITKKQLFLCIICGAMANWLSNVLFLVAYQFLSVSETTMLHFLHPTLIAIFMSVVYKERFSAAKLGAIICSVASMILITGEMSGGSLTGIAAAVLTGVCYAFYPVMLEVSSLKDVESSTVVLYMNISCVVCAGVVSVCTGTFSLPISTEVWVCDVLSAVTNFGGYILSAYSVHVMGATNTSFGAMFEPIASCVIATVFLNQPMQNNVFLAGCLVLLSVFFCSMNNRPVKKRKHRLFISKEKAAE
ncbi:MAG: DMT family transporter [Eubacteriales bacterium]|nr:DMT family transporter [Eubacteriales bacterium]